MKIADILVEVFVAVLVVFFMAFSCAKFDVYDKVLEKINDTKSPLKIS